MAMLVGGGTMQNTNAVFECCNEEDELVNQKRESTVNNLLTRLEELHGGWEAFEARPFARMAA
jgi:hypothetical protein